VRYDLNCVESTVKLQTTSLVRGQLLMLWSILFCHMGTCQSAVCTLCSRLCCAVVLVSVKVVYW